MDHKLYSAANAFTQYLGLGVIAMVSLVITAYLILRKIDPVNNLAIFVLSGVSLACLSRIFFNINPHHYGFYLMVPGLILYCVIFYRLIFIFHARYYPNLSRLFVIIILNLFWLTQAHIFWNISARMYTLRTLNIDTGRGAFIVYPTLETIRVYEAIDYLLKNSKPDDTVEVMPEGFGINFLSRRRRAMPYSSYQPDVFRIFGEEKIISDFTDARVDYIVITARDCGEFGSKAFGVTYAQKFHAWILTNYDMVARFGPYPFTAPEFGTAIFKKKASK